MKLPSFLEHLRPHKTVPMTPWRANHPWDLSLPRVAILWFGLVIFGFGDALVIQSNLGNAPWTVLAEGLTLHSPLNLGEATFVISLIVMALWIPLKIRPGFGTISNMVLIAAAIEFGATHFPRQETFFAGVLSAFLGS